MTQHRVNETNMDADRFANLVIKQFVQNKHEIHIGKTKFLNILIRIVPSMAVNLINQQYPQ
ncbi:MAG: hypothetical protein B6D76_17630 [gamma proteobacterium symbiont of Stewartia floridana]|nr:MAG: hypothetical protein B6D76_17630 [gamma proteobacterium symbiont of Stewartia floridana]RLW57798.1 MAG: hypothetical protein B6D75_16030 [gamma proteobacterium symbiont of Stewartia floridana]RLW63380.1 MAG: hypothetical protein B6D73_15530 [gamma proteobacterium symbiont of Stewartia floridana]